MSLKIQKLMKILTSAKSNSHEFHKNQPLQYSLNNAFLQQPKVKSCLMGFRKEQWFQKMRKYDDLVLNATHLCCCHHHSILSLSSTITHTHTNTHIFTTPLLSKTADRCTITLTVVFQVYLYSMEPRLNEVSQVPKIFLTYRNLSFLGTQMEKLLG